MHTNNIELKYLLQNQASPEITINESLTKLDALIFNTPKAMVENLPQDAKNGEIYICGKTSENANKIAVLINGSWVVFVPKNGMVVSLQSTGKQMQFLNNEWAEVVKGFVRDIDLQSYVKKTDIANFVIQNDLIPYARLADLSNKNYIINGNFDLWQRGFSFLNAAASSYFADRWCGRSFNSSSAMQVTRINENMPIGASFGMRVARPAGNAQTSHIAVAQVIEHDVVQKLAGQLVTVSAKVRLGVDLKNASGKIKMQLVCGGGIEGSVSPFGFAIASQIVGVVETGMEKNVWHNVKITALVPLAARSLMVNFLNESPNGSATVNDFFEISQVKLEIGVMQTQFVPESLNDVLIACQYFYERITADVAGVSLWIGFAQAASIVRIPFAYKQVKRTIPVIASNTQNIFHIIRNGATVVSSNITFARIAIHAARADVTPATPLVAGETIMIGFAQARDFVEINAEI